MRHHLVRALASILGTFAAISIIALLAGCGSSAIATSTPTATPLPTATSTPQPACVALVPGSAPYTSISGLPHMQLPADAYVGPATPTGGGLGQYTVATYTICFPGGESQIDGPAHSTISQLVAMGWKLNNVFPDPSTFAYLDYCSNSHNCLNDAGSPNPFTFAGFDQYASHPGGFETFQLQVAGISAPTCLNDPQYYTGTPQYTLYYDGNSASSNGQQNHFQMPPGTRVSTFKGGGTAGSTYVYFCSAGSQSSVVGFLQQAMHNVGWAISNASASGFTAKFGSNPTYQIDVLVQNTNNYYLRVYAPM